MIALLCSDDCGPADRQGACRGSPVLTERHQECYSSQMLEEGYLAVHVLLDQGCGHSGGTGCGGPGHQPMVRLLQKCIFLRPHSLAGMCVLLDAVCSRQGNYAGPIVNLSGGLLIDSARNVHERQCCASLVRSTFCFVAKQSAIGVTQGSAVPGMWTPE